MPAESITPHADDEDDPLRLALKKANEILSWKQLHWLAKGAGFPLETGPANLGKFVAHQVKELNPQDRRKLERFFASETGHVIRHEKRGHGTLAPLTDLLRDGAKHPEKRDIRGWFYALHGSYIEDNQFVVRAIEIEYGSDSLLHVRNLLNDSHHHGDLLDAFGNVFFSNGKPHIITHHRDNARGTVLFVGDKLLPLDGKLIQRVTGQMIGMTRDGKHFYRAMLLIRAPAGVAETELLTNTGIRPFGQWPETFQAYFKDLRKQMPEQPFADPLLRL